MKEYDYSQPGGYFVTIVTKDRAMLLGTIVDGTVVLSPSGEIIAYWWRQIPRHFEFVECDQFIIMPNHIHGIMIIHEHPNVGAAAGPRPDQGVPPAGVRKPGVRQPDPYTDQKRPTLGQVVAYFKYQSTKQINANLGCAGNKIWQRNYYERVLRGDDELNRAKEYILNNPLQWEMDRENPVVSGSEERGK